MTTEPLTAEALRQLAREDLLVIAAEEAGEVVQAATKCLRFGYEHHQPGYGINCEVLAKEVGDLLGIVDALHLDPSIIAKARASKIEKATRVMNEIDAARLTSPAPSPAGGGAHPQCKLCDGHHPTEGWAYNWAAGDCFELSGAKTPAPAPASAPPPAWPHQFKVEVSEMRESHQTTYWVVLTRVGGSDSVFASPEDGRITPFKSTNREHAEHEAREWAAFLGATGSAQAADGEGEGRRASNDTAAGHLKSCETVPSPSSAPDEIEGLVKEWGDYKELVGPGARVTDIGDRMAAALAKLKGERDAQHRQLCDILGLHYHAMGAIVVEHVSDLKDDMLRLHREKMDAIERAQKAETDLTRYKAVAEAAQRMRSIFKSELSDPGQYISACRQLDAALASLPTADTGGE